MSAFLLILTIVLLVIVVLQISKAAELARVLKGDSDYEESNGNLALITTVVGFVILVASLWSIFTYKDRFLPVPASEQGVWIQSMINWTMFFTCAVYIITQILLFWFVYKYKFSSKRRAFWYPDNGALELAWTVVPAIVLTVLVILGIQKWFKVFSETPTDAIVVDVTAQQFKWTLRYPGNDNVLGARDFSLTNSNNELGVNWNDKNSHDDFFADDMVIPVNTPVLVKISALDVLHNVNLVHFRVKMDAVPGIPTKMWFRPTITTDSMRLILNNPEFEYELNCSELCGSGHYNMRKVIKVVSLDEYKKWARTQSLENAFYTKNVQPELAASTAQTDTTSSSKEAAITTATN
ncbi:MAG: cytochrome c oxidase subunit II [Chitinophagales bacterium]|nr:cytochrome c oxidase subunit II [Chitinophagales bacterium]